MSERKNRTAFDTDVADRARIDADTVEELKEFISKLAQSKDRVGALEQNDLSGMVAFLDTFVNPAAEAKFILHHVTKAVTEERPETLLRWALVFTLRNARIAPESLHHEVMKVLQLKPH